MGVSRKEAIFNRLSLRMDVPPFSNSRYAESDIPNLCAISSWVNLWDSLTLRMFFLIEVLSMSQSVWSWAKVLVMTLRYKPENQTIRLKNRLKKRKSIKKRKISAGLPVFWSKFTCFCLRLCSTLSLLVL